MTDATLAREYAQRARATANQIDHVDEEDDLRDLAQLLERLADTAERPALSPAQVNLVGDLIETAAESWGKGPRGLDELRRFAKQLGLGGSAEE